MRDWAVVSLFELSLSRRARLTSPASPGWLSLSAGRGCCWLPGLSMYHLLGDKHVHKHDGQVEGSTIYKVYELTQTFLLFCASVSSYKEQATTLYVGKGFM